MPDFIFLIIVIALPLLLVYYLFFVRDPYSSLPEFNLQELAKFNGSSGKTYVGVDTLVFDVSSSDFYKPNGSYSVFAGKDATVALARMSLNECDLNKEDILTAKEQETLKEWKNFYKIKKNYPVVGRLVKKTKYS
jgi:membrane-associated progesterone receptor component